MRDVHTYLGLDLGIKRIGVAIGNDLTLKARELGVIYNHKDGSIHWEDITTLVGEYNIYKIIVGLALGVDKGEQMMSGFSRNFASECTKRFGIAVILVDEYLTSNQAKHELKYNHYHKNADRVAVDKRSARLILQQYFNDEY